MRQHDTSVLCTVGALALVLVLWIGLGSLHAGEEGGGQEQRISGPQSYKNLSLFLIHGPDQIEAKNLITLQEALDQQLVTVVETGNVGELSIENHSKSYSVYVQAGDIVKGGRQDRALAHDLLVPPQSGNKPIKSFCVEQGRWSRRGNESDSSFSSSNDMLASKELRLAAKQQEDQSAVWSNVARTQEKLGRNLQQEVRSSQSGSSLQLTLEDADVEKATQEYLSALTGVIDEEEDVIGFAYAVNGEISGLDVYAASGLFRKLWPKLLKASVVEAIAELTASPDDPDPVSVEQVRSFMAEAKQVGNESKRALATETEMVIRDGDDAVVFETTDQAHQGAVIHSNTIRK